MEFLQNWLGESYIFLGIRFWNPSASRCSNLLPRTTVLEYRIINTKQYFQRLFGCLRPLVRFRPRLLRDQPGRRDGRDFLLQGHDAVHGLCLPNKRQTGGGALQVSLLALFRIVLHVQKYLFWHFDKCDRSSSFFCLATASSPRWGACLSR